MKITGEHHTGITNGGTKPEEIIHVLNITDIKKIRIVKENGKIVFKIYSPKFKGLKEGCITEMFYVDTEYIITGGKR